MATAMATPWALPSLSMLCTFFPKKGASIRKVLRREPADQLLHLLVDQLQPLHNYLCGPVISIYHFDQANPVTHALYESIPHDDGTRIDPQNYFRRLLHREDYF